VGMCEQSAESEIDGPNLVEGNGKGKEEDSDLVTLDLDSVFKVGFETDIGFPL